MIAGIIADNYKYKWFVDELAKKGFTDYEVSKFTKGET